MPDPRVSLRLVGSDEDNSAVRFDDFRVFCDKLSECLRHAEMAVTRQSGKIRYRVAGLEGGSAIMVLEAVAPRSTKTRDRRAEVLSFFKKTVADLQKGVEIDRRVTPDDLVVFRELRASLKRTKEVWIETNEITSQYIANIDKLLETPVVTEGSVSGFVHGLNVHNRNEFFLYPPIPGFRIVCSFPEEMFEVVRTAIKRNVTVAGTLYHHPDRPFPDRVQVKEIEIHPPDNELPKLRDLRGLLHGCTGGRGAVDFVRALRDE